MKQVILIVGVILVLALVWRFAFDGNAGSAIERDSRATPGVERRVDPLAPLAVDVAQGPTREALVEANAVEKVEEVAAPRGTIAVRVVERSTGAPVPGAVVQWLWYEGRTSSIGHRARSVLEVERLLDELGEQTVADDEGWVRIASRRGELAIVARAPGLFAYRATVGDGPGELRLELRPDASVEARVVDSNGAPAVNIPVGRRYVSAVRTSDERGHVFTDAEGRATIPHVLEPWGKSGQQAIGVFALLREPVHHILDFDDLPREPIELRLPPTGSLEVLALERDGAPASVGSVEVQVERPLVNGRPDPGTYAASVHAPTENGRALFRYVDLGLQLVIEVAPDQSALPTRVKASGPVTAGERSTVEVHLGSDLATLRLRALDEHGEPQRSTELEWSVHAPGAPTGSVHRATTDDAGRLEIALRPQLWRPTKRVLRVRELAGSPLREGLLNIADDYEQGVHELGDITLEPAPLLAAGLVFESDGSPSIETDVWIRLVSATKSSSDMQGDEDAGPNWQSTTLRTKTAVDGSFALYGRVPRGVLLVSAGSERHNTSVECGQGTQDLRLVLQVTGTLTGRLLSDGETRPDRVQVTARLDVADDGRDLLQHQFSKYGTVRADGSFAFTDLLPGLWSLQVGSRELGPFRPLRTFEGIRVEAGERTFDPRLDPIDLRALLRRVVIELVVPEDELDRSDLQVHCEWSSSDGRTQAKFATNRIELFLADTPLDVSCEVAGYRSVRLVGVDGDRRVELVPGIPFRLELPRDLRLPADPARVLLEVRRPHPVRLPAVRLHLDENREVATRASEPAAFLVYLTIRREDGLGLEQRLRRATRIEIVESDDEQVFELDVTQAELDDAVHRLLAQPQPPR